ncbi:hypothetical protein GCK72_022795 [Caenorhabditis remanei]|uniref:Uncharacterized protein n=1 Tax=Caenorhabditis remanei TaxID=31234 RepID=A0A6A5FUV6_CAERE|nr:hypothetical protein GCK72_022795 [Caenorhabditis remanei]KAF1746342.1 hypothetical protein GCK72_022795 [Caenorhabditis remanei]
MKRSLGSNNGSKDSSGCCKLENQEVLLKFPKLAHAEAVERDISKVVTHVRNDIEKVNLCNVWPCKDASESVRHQIHEAIRFKDCQATKKWMEVTNREIQEHFDAELSRVGWPVEDQESSRKEVR